MPILMLSMVGAIIGYLLLGFAQSLWVVALARLLAGFMAGNISAAQAYITDITSEENRARGKGLIGAAFGLGFVIGPALGGLLAGSDPRLPFWVAAALSLANFCYGLFVLPESLPPEKRSSRLSLRRANPVGALQLLRRCRHAAQSPSLYQRSRHRSL